MPSLGMVGGLGYGFVKGLICPDDLRGLAARVLDDHFLVGERRITGRRLAISNVEADIITCLAMHRDFSSIGVPQDREAFSFLDALAMAVIGIEFQGEHAASFCF